MTIELLKKRITANAITYDSHTFNGVGEAFAELEKLRAEILEAQTFLQNAPPSATGHRWAKIKALGRQRAALYLIRSWAEDAVK